MKSGYTKPGGDIMFERNPETDRYGDGDVPEVDYKPYQDNNFEPHPQTQGENRAENSKRNSEK